MVEKKNRGRSARQARLVELIRQNRVGSQLEARRLLAAEGYTATQTTISRDLEAVGAVRMHAGGRLGYALPEKGSEYGMPLRQVLRSFVISVNASGNMAVIKTPPGHAQMVAAAIDRAQLRGLLGTVAGDDTVFICADQKTGGQGIARALEGAGRSSP